MNMIGRMAGALLLGLLSARPVAAENAIPLYYNERPPYLIPGPDGAATGLTGSPAAKAFSEAGIAFVWRKMPTNRQLLSIKSGTAIECAVGWFKTPEREQFAKFTKAIYRDKPTVILAPNRFTVKENARFADILRIEGIRVLSKDNFSYGPFIDHLIATLKPRVVNTTAESILMVEMLRVDRADFMLMAEEEATYLTEEPKFGLNDFHLIRLPDMPPGEKRHIMCSKLVPDEVINRLNKFIAFE
jgi:polar amino acid transport system substrate-binding protein